jgi:hypothetical protein
MDYQYYMRKVHSLSPALHNNLVEHARTTPLDISKSYFNNRHPGFNSRTFKLEAGQTQAAFLSSVDKSVQDIVADLAYLYPPESFHAYEINSLQVGGKILLHTDQTPTTTSKIWRVPQYHSVHIPCTGRGLYESKRGYGEEFEKMYMELGSVYSYNNYVLHKVENISDVVRFNVVLHYHDLQWITKARLYEYLGITDSKF